MTNIIPNSPIIANKGLISLPDLEKHNQWVNWKYVNVKGKQEKIPFIPGTDNWAKSNDPRTWRSFETASNNAALYEGVGFVFTENDNVSGVDLDTCRDTVTGEIELWAQIIINLCNSYSEISPSQTGVKIFIKGKYKFSKDKTNYLLPQGFNVPTGSKKKMELYRAGVYFTCTYNHLGNTPTSITDNPDLLEILPIIGQLLEKETTYKLLIGEVKDYRSRSEAIHVLLKETARLTKNSEHIYAIADTSLTPKWHEADERYRQREIDQALQAVEDEPVKKADRPTPTFELLTAQEVIDLPPLVMLDTHRKIPKAATVLHYAPSGALKSFYALQEVALPLSQNVPVVYVMGENANTYGERMKAWLTYNELIEPPPHFWALRKGIRLMDDQQVDAFIEFIKPIQPQVIILDTLSTCIAGDGDENKAQDMQKVVGNANRIRDEVQCTVWIIHHTGKSGDYRGSSVLHADVDMVIEQSIVDEKDDKDLENENRKLSMIEAAHFKKILLHYRKWKGKEIKDRYFQAEYREESLVLSEIDKPQKTSRKGALSKTQQKIVQVLREQGELEPQAIISSIDGNERTVRSELSRLVQKGVIEKPKGKGKGYRLVHSG